MPKKVMIAVGTRPEAIKLAPVITTLRKRSDVFDTIVCSSGQHREMLDQAFTTFGLIPDIKLDVMKPNQTLPNLTAILVSKFSAAIASVRPDFVIVQGDTTTAFTAALAAYYARVSVAHVEAGLRSHDRDNPFPEEINRRLISAVADIHFAPTEGAAAALHAENIPPPAVHMVGNTIVDALMMLQARLGSSDGMALVSPSVRALSDGTKRLILVTCHRRENFGADLAAICRAIQRIARDQPDTRIVFPVHLNPNVRAQVMPLLGTSPNIVLIDPVTYPELIHLLSRAVLVLSDSGGIQEEAPSFGVPVLVLRRKTERPEGIEAGIAQLVGADEDLIVARSQALLSRNHAERKTTFINPYGDGHASERIANVMAQLS